MLNDARDGYFHEFHCDEYETYGIIEFLDGTISVINVKQFKFKEPPYPEMPPIPNWLICPAISKS
jgi:hypothetical protein